MSDGVARDGPKRAPDASRPIPGGPTEDKRADTGREGVAATKSTTNDGATAATSPKPPPSPPRPAPSTPTDEPAEAKRGQSAPGGGASEAPADASEASPAPKATTAVDDALDTSRQHAPEANKEIRIRVFGRTDVGQVREHNEDNFIVADLTKASRGLMEADRTQIVGERGALLGVCDGMGGAAAGEVASQLAVDIIYQKMAAGDPPKDHDELASRLVQAIEAAGLRIFSEAKLDRTRRGMGTTSTIAALVDDHLFLGQVGDSRGYILRGERLVQVTRDQSLVNQLIEAGQLTEEEAETFEHNNIILQALGTSDTVQVDLTYVPLKRGDTLLLCSDGLSGMVRNDEIREVLRTFDDPLEACKLLTDRANQAGGHDNITVVVARFEGEGLVEPAQVEIDGLRYQKYQLPEPPASSIPSAEASRRVKELEQSKVSVRPPPVRDRSRATNGGPDIEVSEQDADEDFDDDYAPDNRLRGDEPIHIPTEGAPSWLVTMMIVSAILCVSIAGYYLLR